MVNKGTKGIGDRIASVDLPRLIILLTALFAADVLIDDLPTKSKTKQESRVETAGIFIVTLIQMRLYKISSTMCLLVNAEQ